VGMIRPKTANPCILHTQGATAPLPPGSLGAYQQWGGPTSRGEALREAKIPCPEAWWTKEGPLWPKNYNRHRMGTYRSL
jgi:hypothetical protein